MCTEFLVKQKDINLLLSLYLEENKPTITAYSMATAVVLAQCFYFTCNFGFCLLESSV